MTKLQTEKDGRAFAIAAMSRLSKVDADEATVYPFPFPIQREDAACFGVGGEKLAPYRKGPQDATLQRDLFNIFKSGSEAAQRGFCSILTDLLASDVQRGMLGTYRRLEAAGFMRPWGTPGTAYPVKVQTKKAERANAAQLEKDSAEASKREEARLIGGHSEINKSEPVTVETFLESSGVARRAATAYLAKPYAEMETAAKKDKATAETFAIYAHAIEEVEGSYLLLHEYLVRARRSMTAAVLARKDGAVVIKAVSRRTK